MSLLLKNPQESVTKIENFLRKTFQQQKKTQAVIAVSGGIDSAVALTFLTKALPPAQIWPVFLPYQDQSIEDGHAICDFLKIPMARCTTIQIESIVESAAQLLQIEEHDHTRLGNLMARARMMAVFDIAKKRDALVCGTENKSEHYLGYFTRFGDAASDIEPISHLYKTQVRQLAEFLELPPVFLEKPPSAGLWSGQTDEIEMGFTYEQADQVLHELIDQQKLPAEIYLENVAPEVVQKVTNQVNAMKFKREVPYEL